MRQRMHAIAVIIILFVAAVSVSLASVPSVDLSVMSASDLKQFRKDIASEIGIHHSVDSKTEKAIMEAAESVAEEYYRQKGITVSWAWHSWEYDYKRDKDFISFSTHLDYKDRDGKNRQVKVAADLIWNGRNYRVYHLYLDKQLVLSDEKGIPSDHLVDSSNVVINEKTGISLSLLSAQDLKDLDRQISRELDINHEPHNSGRVNSVLKRTVEELYKAKGIAKVEWPWFDYNYTCDWNCYTERTRITFEENGNKYRDIPVYAELFPVGGSYAVYYLEIDGVVITDRMDQVDSIEGKLFLNSRKYMEAKQLLAEGRYDEAMMRLDDLGDFDDSASLLADCQKRNSQISYEEACALQESGNWEQAVEIFDGIGDFSDSAARAELCREEIRKDQYDAAVVLMAEGKYVEAMAGFTALGTYLDSTEQVAACQGILNQQAYDEAELLFAAGEYEKAGLAFELLGDFDDSTEKTTILRNIISSIDRELSFAEDEIHLFPGEATMLMPDITKIEANAPDNTVLVYSSGDPKVASVDASGMVSAMSSGEAVIHCEAADNPYIAADVTVHVEKKVKKIILGEVKLDLAVPGRNSEHHLTVIFEPADAYVQTGIWSSSNEAVATVDQEGNVTAVGSGKAVITFISDDDSKTKMEAKCDVTVSQAVTELYLNETSGTVYVGKPITLKATVGPTTAKNKKVEWSSSDESVATVSTNGQVKGVGPGNVIITAKSQDGPSATYHATVKMQPVTLKISVKAKQEYNDHVGKSWGKQLYVDGEPVKGTAKITVENGDRFTIEYEIWENDKNPDVGSCKRMVEVTPELMKNGVTIDEYVTVYENGGRYSGHSSGWAVTITIKP